MPSKNFFLYTRGWLPLACPETRRVTLFPVHAGMAPLTCFTSHRASTFSCTRGDGSYRNVHYLSRKGFFLYTRGWLLVPVTREDQANLFPVHAGMAPIRGLHTGDYRAFSCTRGDGSALATSLIVEDAFFLYTRGWLRSVFGTDWKSAVLPLYMGMASCRGSPDSYHLAPTLCG